MSNKTNQEISLFINLGNDYYSSNQYELAIENYKKALELDIKNSSLFHTLGSIYIETGEYNLAIENLTKSIELDSNNIESYYLLGLAYDIRGEYSLALDNYRQVLNLNSSHSGAIVAIDNLKQILSINYEDALFYYNQAKTNIVNNNFDKAIELLNQALTLNPDLTEAYFELGSLYFQQDDYYLAQENLDRAAKLKSDYAHSDIYKNLQIKLAEDKNATKLLTGLRDKLNNLNPRNRSLRLLKTSKMWNFDLGLLDKIEATSSETILNSLLNDITPITLLTIEASQEPAENLSKQQQLNQDYYSSLNLLYRNTNAIESETGIYDLYVGYPFIECLTTDGAYLRAPLLLNPCHLVKSKNGGNSWLLKTDNEFRPVFNETLLMGLQKFNKLVIPPDFLDKEKELEEENLLTWTIDYLKENGINFECTDCVNGKINPLPELKMTELPPLEQGKIYIRPHAILGIFPQSTSNLRPDYDNMINNPSNLNNVLELLGKIDCRDNLNQIIDYEDIDKQSEINRFTITDTDESQDRIMCAFRTGRSFVVHGPPGTGKSHIFLNMIAEAMAQNKKVLVVCQKRAALDVIYNRLSAEGLDKFIALVHDFDRDKKLIFDKLKTLSSTARHLPASPTDISIQESFENKALLINDLISTLNTFNQTLKNKTQMELSPYEIYCRLSKIETKFKDKIIADFDGIKYHSFLDILSPLLKLAAYTEKFTPEEYLLKDRKSWSGKSDAFKNQLVQDLQFILELNNKIISTEKYFQTRGLLTLSGTDRDKSLYSQLNTFINYFINRRTTINNYPDHLRKDREDFEVIKSRFVIIIDLLEKPQNYDLTLAELYRKVYEADKETVISVAGYEDGVKYTNLDSLAKPVLQLSDYYTRFENENILLNKQNRTDWSKLKADQIQDIKTHILNAINSNKNQLSTLSQLTKFNLSPDDIKQTADIINDLSAFFKLIRSDNKVLSCVLDWEKSACPEFDYLTIASEVQNCLDKINNTGLIIFESLNLKDIDLLLNSLKTFSTYKSFIRYLIPSWWILKNNINSLISQSGLKINDHNFDEILQRAELTAAHHRLEQLLNSELAFINKNSGLSKSDIVNLAVKSIPFFNAFKTLRRINTGNIIKNLSEIDILNQINNICEYFDLINNYFSNYQDCLKSLDSLNILLKANLLDTLKDLIAQDKNINDYLIKISSELGYFEEFRVVDEMHNNLNDKQKYILDTLVKQYPQGNSNSSYDWNRIIQDSFLVNWLLRAETKNSILKDYYFTELMEIGTDNKKAEITEILDIITTSFVICENICLTIDKLNFAFDDPLIAKLKETINNCSQLSKLIETILKQTDDFSSLVDMDTITASLTVLQKDLLNQTQKNHSLSGKDLAFKWEKSLLYSYLSYWINIIEEENPVLKQFSGSKGLEIIDQLQKEYLDKLKLNKELIINNLTTRLSQLPSTDLIIKGKKLKNLDYQINKKRQLWSLRKLMDEFGDSHILKMLPCWLMSPEAVSAVMPFKNDFFDIVIFDEASQCAQEYALPSLVRARQVIIGGDEKQLTPLNLFHTTLEDTTELEAFKEEKSLLQLACKRYPVYLLSWHYRSKYEELINFSNHAFYSGKIQISPDRTTGMNSSAIEWIRVKDAVWDSKCNQLEAEEVIKVLNKIITSKDNNQTVGIISFNSTQQELILNLIDQKEQQSDTFARALEKMRNLDLDSRLFVKNIENVQGDERDIIIFSIGYAPNKQGKTFVNFGLLNREGGENRLNVAITRARQKVIILSSLDPEDLKVENSKNAGPRLFKKYLQYTVSNSSNQYDLVEKILKDVNSDYFALNTQCMEYEKYNYKDDIFNTLVKLGYKADKNVGYSDYKVDIAIRNPDRDNEYILGIECDSEKFFSTASARSRYLSRRNFLTNKGWNIIHIWSIDWYYNRKIEIDRITAFLKPDN